MRPERALVCGRAGCGGELRRTSAGFGHVVNPKDRHHYPRPRLAPEPAAHSVPGGARTFGGGGRLRRQEPATS